MDVLYEQRIVQNPALGAEILWAASVAAFRAQDRTRGLPFWAAFLVLPIVFHRRSSEVLRGKTSPAALFKALAERPEMSVGLQARTEALAQCSLQSLSVAMHTGLLDFDPRPTEFFPRRLSLPVPHLTDEVKDSINAAKRLGASFTEITFEQACSHLSVRF